MTSEAQATRVPQADRSRAMRARLLEATVDLLVERGFAGTSTTLVSERAGVSRGAQLHHFPTKNDLVVAAVEHLTERRGAELAAAFAELSAEPVATATGRRTRLRAVLEMLGDHFTSPVFAAALELWVAARTDPALLAAVEPLEQRVGRETHRLTVSALGADESRAGVRELVQATLDLVRGLGLAATVTDDSARRRRILRVVGRRARQGAPVTSHPPDGFPLERVEVQDPGSPPHAQPRMEFHSCEWKSIGAATTAPPRPTRRAAHDRRAHPGARRPRRRGRPARAAGRRPRRRGLAHADPGSRAGTSPPRWPTSPGPTTWRARRRPTRRPGTRWSSTRSRTRRATSTGRPSPSRREPGLLARWRRARADLHAALAAHPHGEKMPWFGPPMSATSMATARLMETWAHSLDVHAGLGAPVEDTDRLRHIAHLGVRTRNFAFGVHGLDAPAEEFRDRPRRALAATSGAGDRRTPTQTLTGSAGDFCRLVTQRVHRGDTDLVATGVDVDRWLDIAQAFAGQPGGGRDAT